MKQVRTIDRAEMLAVLSYDPETGVLTWLPRPNSPQRNARFAGKEAGTVTTTADGKSYRLISVGVTRYLAHRIAWTMVNGPIPEGCQIDHEDGNGLNNRLANLRVVTESGNQMNARRSTKNTSGHVGVRRCATKAEMYQAFAIVDGKFFQIGLHPTVEGAAAMRKAFSARAGFHPNHGQDRPL